MTTEPNGYPPAAANFRDSLSRAAAALRLTASRLYHVEEAIAHVVSSAPDGPPAARLANLQQLDLTVQEIGAVAEFLDALARQTQPEWPADVDEATCAIRLHDLALFLLGREPASGPRDEDDDCEFFDAPALGAS
jgi:hypothetical protein